jgi:hypothetical protein
MNPSLYHKFLDISIIPTGLNHIEANKPLSDSKLDVPSLGFSDPIYGCCFYPLSIFKSTPTSNGEGMGRK